MWRRGTPHLGDRHLRFDVEGPDVSELQERLRRLGYDTGRADGAFGYWTEEALREFQRDHHLRVDGIAGSEVFQALDHLSGAGATRRRIHVVRQGETLRRIAARYGVHPAALRDANHLYSRRPPPAGRRLRVTSRLVLGWLSTRVERRSARSLTKHHERLSGVLADGTAVDATGQVIPAAQEADPWRLSRRHRLAGFVELDLTEMSLPRRRKVVNDRAASLAEWVRESDAQGCLLHLNRPRRGEGRRLRRLVQSISEGLGGDRDAGIPLYLSIPPPPLSRFRAWREGLEEVNWGALTAPAEAIVLRMHLAERAGRRVRAGPPGGYRRVHRALKRLIDEIPPWKILLSIPVCAYDFTLDHPGGPWAVEPPKLVSYQAAITRARLERADVVWDEEARAPWYEYVSDERPHRTWLENRRSFAAKLDIVNRMELGGVALWRLGAEDPRIWEVVPRKFGTSRFS